MKHLLQGLYGADALVCHNKQHNTVNTLAPALDNDIIINIS